MRDWRNAAISSRREAISAAPPVSVSGEAASRPTKEVKLARALFHPPAASAGPSAHYCGPRRAQGRGERDRGLIGTMLDSVAYPAPNVPCPNPGSEGLSGPARLRKVIHVDMDAFCASVEPRQPGAQGQARRGRGSASSWPSPAPRPVAAASDRPCPPSRLWADGRTVYPPRPPSSTSATGSAPPPVYSVTWAGTGFLA